MGFSPDRLRGHRHGQKLHVAALAKAAGMLPERLSSIEAGREQPTNDEVAALERSLQVGTEGLDEVRTTPTQNYLSAVLTYARSLTEDEIEIAAYTIRQIRAAS